ncbi:MAG: hypothetical protein IT200_17830 [Thermoleophilia bacterium]|nr:hypothetical protein [Thermoleophilia bacterium]
MHIAVGDDAVWVAGPGDALTRVDTATGTVAARGSTRGGVTALAADDADLWVLATGRIARYDRRTLAPRGAWRVPRSLRGLAVTGGGVWSVAGGSGRVVRIVPGGIREVPARQTGIAMLAGGGGRMYALAVRRRDGRTRCFLKRLDEATARVVDGAPIGCTPTRIVADGRWVWVLYGGGRTLVRRDGRTARGADHPIRAIPFPIDAATAGGSLLVMGDYGAGLRRVDRTRAVPVGPVIRLTSQPSALAGGPAGAWAASAAGGGVLMQLADGAAQPARTIRLG